MDDSTGFFGAWTKWISMASIQGIGFILFVLVTCWLIRKSSQWAQCWLWRLAFLKLVLLLIFVSPVQLPILPRTADNPVETELLALDSNSAAISYLAGHEDNPVFIESSQTPMEMLSETKESIPNLEPTQAPGSFTWSLRSLHLQTILLVLWLTGVAIGLARLARAFYVHSIFRRKITLIKDSRYSKFLAQLAQQFNISHTHFARAFRSHTITVPYGIALTSDRDSANSG